MPSILKHFSDLSAEKYVLLPAEELVVEPEPPPPPPEPEAPPPPETPAEEPEPESEPPPEPEPEPEPEPDPIELAMAQAQAILEDARQDAREERDAAWAAFQQEMEDARRMAIQEGYQRGYADGMAAAQRDAQEELNRRAADQASAIEAFLEGAAKARDRVIDSCREELKDLALAIAEKVIRVSLRGSTDILRRMVEAATEKKKRCEWAHIYVADCDVRGSANTIPELISAMRGISDRVRVVAMADDESGTCIIEMPDEILDASVSTQLGNIRETLGNASLDDDEPRGREMENSHVP